MNRVSQECWKHLNTKHWTWCLLSSERLSTSTRELTLDQWQNRSLCTFTFSNLYLRAEWDQDGLKVIPKHWSNYWEFKSEAWIVFGNYQGSGVRRDHEYSVVWTSSRTPVLNWKRKLFACRTEWGRTWRFENSCGRAWKQCRSLIQKQIKKFPCAYKKRKTKKKSYAQRKAMNCPEVETCKTGWNSPFRTWSNEDTHEA